MTTTDMAGAPGGAGGPREGAWPGRPPGVPGDVPPPSLPLSFLAAAAAGLVACGAALAWAARAAAGDPTAAEVVAAAHAGMLATLSMAVLGALHQFTPVVTRRPLRSVRLGRATFLAWLGAAWLLPAGFAAGRQAVIEAGGACAATAVILLVVNLWPPLSARGRGAPVAGLRLAVAGFAATAAFGVVYVADLRGGWFGLPGHVLAAHAVIGLFAWLGLTYASVAGKLWPMFLLAHVPGRQAAAWTAVLAIPGGVALLSPGLLLGLAGLAWAGAAMLAIGLAAHLASLAQHLRRRRRKPDLYLAYLITAAAWLPASAGLALAAALVIGRHHHAGMALAAGAVAAAAAWLLEAVAGHAHKIVPFIVWSVLRARGVRTVSGRPLGFADLYGHRAAAATYLLLTAGLAAACAGLAASWPAATAAGGGLLAAAGLLLAVNLSVTPVRLLRAARAPRPGPAGPPPPAPARPGFPPAALPAAAIAISVAAAIMSAAALWPGRPAGGPAGRVAGGPVTTARVELGDMFVRPSSLTVRRGTRLVLHVVNTGALSHDLQLEGGAVGTGMLGPGQSRTADFGVVGRTEQAWCTVPGHKAAGMVLTIRAAAGARPAAGRARHPAPDAVISPGARPGPGWHPFGPALAPAPGGTVHRVTLIARDRVMQVAPGVRQDMWTFNGQVPGPTLRGHVGDLFIVTLVNRTSMDHSIDFHAASQPMEAMRTVGPGQSVTERFRVRYAGIFLYHCGTAPVLEHVANGMFGAMIIDPPRLARVAREFLIVQSELYLGPQGRPGDYAKMLRGQADAVVFNGYADQYLYSPLRVRAGQRVRIWVLDAGPSDDSAFHVVGAQFDTVFSNGGYLLRPGNPADGAAQTLNLMPGEGGFVEFTVAAPGRYEILDHHLDHAASGAAGWLVAGPA